MNTSSHDFIRMVLRIRVFILPSFVMLPFEFTCCFKGFFEIIKLQNHEENFLYAVVKKFLM